VPKKFSAEYQPTKKAKSVGWLNRRRRLARLRLVHAVTTGSLPDDLRNEAAKVLDLDPSNVHVKVLEEFFAQKTKTKNHAHRSS
jgi:ribosomal protein S24E